MWVCTAYTSPQRGRPDQARPGQGPTLPASPSAPQDPTGDAAASSQKHLTYYELDLGLNHVLRKWSEPVDNGANMLIPVPGGGDGPGGVLVCAENFLLYRHQVITAAQ